jgi:hypothetical protein
VTDTHGEVYRVFLDESGPRSERWLWSLAFASCEHGTRTQDLEEEELLPFGSLQRGETLGTMMIQDEVVVL